MAFTTPRMLASMVAAAPGLSPIRQKIQETAPAGKQVDWNKFYYAPPGDKLPLVDPRSITGAKVQNSSISPPPPSSGDRSKSDALYGGAAGVQLAPIGLRGPGDSLRRTTLLG